MVRAGSDFPSEICEVSKSAYAGAASEVDVTFHIGGALVHHFKRIELSTWQLRPISRPVVQAVAIHQRGSMGQGYLVARGMPVERPKGLFSAGGIERNLRPGA